MISTNSITANSKLHAAARIGRVGVERQLAATLFTINVNNNEISNNIRRHFNPLHGR
jgi:hypothetical protein